MFDLEDKIESGELISKKEVERLKSENVALCNEADENAALSMENKMRADRLEVENAALRERLEKAVELPVKVGDTVYLVGMCFSDGYNDNFEPVTSQGWKMYPQKVTEKNLYRICDAMVKGNGFLYEEDAKALLAELKGGSV